jgi:hypothetical protein
METFSGNQLISWKVETDIYGYQIKANETYIVDHHSDIDGRPEYVTLTAWENSHNRDNYYIDENAEKEFGQLVDFPKTEKLVIELRLRQDLADKLPKDKNEKNAFICRAIEYAIDKDTWMAKAHAAKSPAKTAAARENGKKGAQARWNKKE